MQTGIYFGRFQPFHEGHKKCIEHILDKCCRCIVFVRQTPLNEKNPLTYPQRYNMIRDAFPDEDKVPVTYIPDPGINLAVFIGRDVGYELIQLDEETEKISGTDLRKKLYDKNKKEYDPDAPKKVK